MDSPVADVPGIAYWDTDSEQYAFWDPIYDVSRHLPGRKGHDYPNEVVFALTEEREILKEKYFALETEQGEVQEQLNQVQAELDQAKKDLARLRRQAYRRRKRMDAGQKLIRSAYELLDSEDEVTRTAQRSEGSVAKGPLPRPAPPAGTSTDEPPVAERILQIAPTVVMDPAVGPS